MYVHQLAAALEAAAVREGRGQRAPRVHASLLLRPTPARASTTRLTSPEQPHVPQAGSVSAIEAQVLCRHAGQAAGAGIEVNSSAGAGALPRSQGTRIGTCSPALSAKDTRVKDKQAHCQSCLHAGPFTAVAATNSLLEGSGALFEPPQLQPPAPSVEERVDGVAAVASAWLREYLRPGCMIMREKLQEVWHVLR